MAAPTPFILLLYKNLERLERIALVVLILSGITRYFGVPDANSPIKYGLIILGAVYFLFAFRPPEINPDGTKMDLITLIMTTTLPKILWISSAVGVMGLMFYFGGMNGAEQLLLIQATTGAAGVVIWGIGNAMKIRAVERLMTPMTRAIPVMLLGVYILLK